MDGKVVPIMPAVDATLPFGAPAFPAYFAAALYRDEDALSFYGEMDEHTRGRLHTYIDTLSAKEGAEQDMDDTVRRLKAREKGFF